VVHPTSCVCSTVDVTAPAWDEDEVVRLLCWLLDLVSQSPDRLSGKKRIHFGSWITPWLSPYSVIVNSGLSATAASAPSVVRRFFAS
jgi:hypothetical protein